MLSDNLTARVARLLAPGGRVILGIAGCPGAGKSTLAAEVVEHFQASGVPSACIPMDGFHLANAELTRLGKAGRKGSIDTFDAYGYRSVLERARSETDNPVYAPAFDRSIEEPISGSVPILPETCLVVTEGNYLLDNTAPWPAVQRALSEVWFVDIEDAIRTERLVQRHIRFGKTPAEASEWVRKVDELNAERIKQNRSCADLRVVASPVNGEWGLATLRDQHSQVSQ